MLGSLYYGGNRSLVKKRISGISKKGNCDLQKWQREGLTKTWTWTWTSRMLNGGLRPVDLLIFGGWKPWTLVSKQWTSQVDFGD